MLYSVEMRLRVAQGSSPSGVTGHHLLAFFLRLIERVNPALAASLHKDDGPKPFTLSPLSPTPGKRRPSLQEGTLACFRVTLLREEVFAFLADAVRRLPPEMTLPLGEAQVQCEGLATAPDQSPWADFSSFSQLLEDAGTESKLRLAFLSPTTFRSKGERNILFPEPSLVFGSLTARWNAFAPAALNLNLGKAIASQVRISGYRLATRMLDFGTYQELGFMGWASYELDEAIPREQAQALHALGAFSFFGGVGAKTTMGMGQARRFESARPLPHGAGSHPEEGRRPAGSN